MKRAGLLVLLFVFVSVSFGQEGGTPNSEWMYVGSTWWDYQGNGSLGKQIVVGTNGDVHFVWTFGGNAEFSYRQAYYNCWDGASEELMLPSGNQIANVIRSGFCTVGVGLEGHAFPVLDGTLQNGTFMWAGIELVPCSGAFLEDFPWDPMLVPLYGKIDVDREGWLHIACSELESLSGLYTRGFPEYDNNGFGTGIGWDVDLTVIAPENIAFPTIDISCSRLRNRVAVAWIEDPPGAHDPENIFMRISEDGGLNWNDLEPVTNLPPVDTNCTTWPEVCNGDTFRPWHDLSIILDDDDNVHIAFSARGYYYFDSEGEPNPRTSLSSTIWHWSEETEQFSLIGEAWSPPDTGIELGTNNLMCQEPSLAIDTLAGYLYCGFQQFDRHAYSVGGYAMSEYYASVSTDNGRSWAVPTNVSNTPGETNQPEGEQPCERDVTLAKYVSNGFIHTQYLHDYSAGTWVSNEGVAARCSVVYMKTPITDIPTTPLNPPWEFRATGTPVSEEEVALPAEFMLYQNYPNPFNPTTNIQFDLVRAGVVKLVVFDVTGREVATLVDDLQMNAGAHTVAFDRPGLASGVYLARLEMDGTSLTRKMVLLK